MERATRDSNESKEKAGNRLLVIDDDRTFGAIISASAKAKGFEPLYCSSLIDLGSFARIREFDVAIIDYFLGSMQGDEIAAYVDTFFNEIPVIIVSSKPFEEEERAGWPTSVRSFIAKSAGPTAIIDAARNLVNRERLLKRLRHPRTSSPQL